MTRTHLLRLSALLATTLFVTLIVGAVAANPHAQAAPSSPSPNVQFEVVTTTTTTVPVTTTTVTVPAAGVASTSHGPLPITGAPLEQWLLVSVGLIGAGSLILLAAGRRRLSYIQGSRRRNSQHRVQG